MTKIKNVSAGPRGFHASSGFVQLERGATWEGEIDKGELESARSTRFFVIDGKAPDALDHDADGEKGGSVPNEPPSLTGKNKAELLEIAEAEGVEIEDGATNAQIVDAIEAQRAG